MTHHSRQSGSRGMLRHDHRVALGPNFRDLFYRLRSFARGHDVFLKLEGFNVSGSIKVKTAIGLIEDLERRGLVRPHETVIVESSSGNLGIALSLVCAIKGYKFICVTDSNTTRANIRGMELYGATVLIVNDRDADGGFLTDRFRAIDNILQSEPNAVWLNQYDNIANKNIHAAETANEIANEFEKVDWIFVGAGSTGTLAGISERLRHEFPKIKIVAVEPTGSVTFGGSPGMRNIPGIGTSLRPKLADLSNPDRIVAIDEARQSKCVCRSCAITICLLAEAPEPSSPPCRSWPRSSRPAIPSSPSPRTSATSIWTQYTTRPGYRMSSHPRPRRSQGIKAWQPLRSSALFPARQ